MGVWPGLMLQFGVWIRAVPQCIVVATCNCSPWQGGHQCTPPALLPGAAGARNGRARSALHGGGAGAGELLVTAAVVNVGSGGAAQAACACGVSPVLHAMNLPSSKLLTGASSLLASRPAAQLVGSLRWLSSSLKLLARRRPDPTWPSSCSPTSRASWARRWA